MIRIDGGTFPPMNIAGPMFQICADCKELTVVCWIPHLDCVELPPKVSQWPLHQPCFIQLLLHQNTSNRGIQGISSQDEIGLRIQGCQDQCGYQSLLEILKQIPMLASPDVVVLGFCREVM